MNSNCVTLVTLLVASACASDDPSAPKPDIIGAFGGITIVRDDGEGFLLENPEGDDGYFGDAVVIFVEEGVPVVSASGDDTTLADMTIGDRLGVTLSNDPCIDTQPQVCGTTYVQELD